MRFDSRKYNELFPQIEKTEIIRETMVETFKPDGQRFEKKDETETETENLDTGCKICDTAEYHG